MEKDDVHKAFGTVLEDMGRAAREGRARRFTAKRPGKGVEVSVGEVELQPSKGGSADREVDPVAMSEDEEGELLRSLDVQR